MRLYFKILLPLLYFAVGLQLEGLTLAESVDNTKSSTKSSTISNSAVGGKSLKERYSETCAVCHASGTQGAPRSGVEAQWQMRLAKGMDALLTSVKKGYRQMPPMGICFECTDDDFIALIEYMAEPGI